MSPGNVAHQAPLSMEFSRKEYWSGLPFPPPGDLPDPRIRAASPVSPVLQVDSLPQCFPGGARGKEPTCQCRRRKRHGFNPWVRKIPWRRKWQPTPIYLPGKSHGQRSLVGYSPWGSKESDTTEWLSIDIIKKKNFIKGSIWIQQDCEDSKWMTEVWETFW